MKNHPILNRTCIALSVILVITWYSYAPRIDYDPFSGLERVFYDLFFRPIALFSIGTGLIIFLLSITSRYSIRSILLSLCLILVAVSTYVEPIYSKVRYIFLPITYLEWRYELWKEGESPPQKRTKDQIYDQHYQYLLSISESPPPRLHIVGNQCGLIETAQPGLFIDPIGIKDDFGSRFTIEELLHQVIQTRGVYIRIELPEFVEFRNLYTLDLPEECLTKDGGYFAPMTDTGDPLGIVPAIVHILPSPTASGSTVK